MALIIGRAGKTLVLPEPTDWQNSGPRSGSAGSGGWAGSTVSGGFQVSPVTDALRLRDQLLGYVNNPDEPAVPVTSDAQPRDNGYYRVVSCDITTLADSLTTGFFKYRLELEPVQGYAQPQFESIITGALLNNAVGAVTGDMVFFHGFPAAATEYNKGSGGSYYTRHTADGDLLSLGDGDLLFFTGGSVSDTAHFYLTPPNYYVGAARFEQGAPLQPVVGRQLAQNDTVNWRLSNALVQVTPNAAPGKLDVRHWCGGVTASGTANLLSPNDSSFEASIGSWVQNGGGTVAQSGAQFLDGSHSLAMTTSGTTGMNAWSGLYPISANTQYTGVVSLRTAVTARNITPQISFHDSSLAQISVLGGAAVTDSSSGWVQATVTVTSPSNAAYARVVVTFGSSAANEVHYVDNAGLFVGSNTAWRIGGWAYPKTYELSGVTTAGLINGFTSVTVLRNSPEETIIRLGCTVAFGINWGRVNVDLALRRGDRLVRGYLSADAQSDYKIARSVVEAATAITYGAVTAGGIRATSNDTDGNRYVLLSYQVSPTSDLVNGSLKEPAAIQSTFDFAIGSEIGGSGAVAGVDDAISIAKQYLAVQSEKQQTVAR